MSRALVLIVAAALVPAFGCRRRPSPVEAVSVPAPSPTPSSSAVPASSLVPSPDPSASPRHSTLVPVGALPEAWRRAVERVEEVRGSAGGVAVPSELRHYDDDRRFLATQMADSVRRQYEIPHDAAELAEMIRAGQVVALPPLGEEYVLYEVGTDAQEDPLVHYDAATGHDVPLFGSFEDFQREDARLDEASQARGAAANRAREDRVRLQAFYQDTALRDRLIRKHQAITRLASNLDGFSYNLHDRTDRMLLQMKLASYIRPEAREVLLQIARGYHQRFGRQLPVTSIIRTDRYQRRLGRRNPNATEVEIPPHTTGAAFDISYKYMAPDEQNFVMQELARLEDQGRLEALRERRGHVHVYVFGDGQRPPETLVAGFLDSVEAARRLPRGAPNVGPANGSMLSTPAIAESAGAVRGSTGETMPPNGLAAADSGSKDSGANLKAGTSAASRNGTSVKRGRGAPKSSGVRASRRGASKRSTASPPTSRRARSSSHPSRRSR